MAECQTSRGKFESHNTTLTPDDPALLHLPRGGFVMTTAFEHHTGLSGATPTTENPAGFVAALDTTFLAAAGLSLIAFLTSAARGGENS